MIPSSGKFKNKCMYEVQYSVLQGAGGYNNIITRDGTQATMNVKLSTH